MMGPQVYSRLPQEMADVSSAFAFKHKLAYQTGFLFL